MAQVRPHAILRVGKSDRCVLLLRERDGPRYLPILTRLQQAEPIGLCMQRAKLARPRTHDLLVNVAEKLGAEVVRATLYGVKDGIALSRLVLNKDGRDIALECRLSDAISVAMRKGVPITVADEIMRAATIEHRTHRGDPTAVESVEVGEELDAFRDFVETLDLDGL